MMRKMMLAVLYTAFAFGANAGSLEGLLVGDMKKLALVEPAAIPEAVLLDAAEAEHSLAEYRGKWVVLNFWATWCAPCREEMPSLDALQAQMGGKDFQVVAIATGHNPPPAIHKFLDEAGVKNLPVLLDPRQALAREMGVMGMPVTVLIDRQGNEIARLMGGADWASETALALVRQATAP